jgi:hypothetical protein
VLSIRWLVLLSCAGCSYHSDDLFSAPVLLVSVLSVGVLLRVVLGDGDSARHPAEEPRAESIPRNPPGATPLLCDGCELFLVVRERLRRGEITEAEALDMLEGRRAAS